MLISGAFEQRRRLHDRCSSGRDVRLLPRSRGRRGNASVPSAGLSVTIDTAAPAAPAAPDLQAGSDSGQSNSDNNTSDNTPTFDVPASPFFRFFRDGVLISTAFQSGGTFTPAAQADGTFSFTVSAVDAAGNASTPSAGLSVTLDSLAPSAPAAPDLQAGSDSGQSNSDNNTSDNTPTFDVSASPFFRFFRDGVLISGAFENGAAFTTGAQADGTFAYTLAAVDAAGNESTPSAGLSVTIDSVAPSAPAAPDLQAGSDSGQSNTDNITNDNTPTFDVRPRPSSASSATAC